MYMAEKIMKTHEENIRKHEKPGEGRREGPRGGRVSDRGRGFRVHPQGFSPAKTISSLAAGVESWVSGVDPSM